MSAHLLCLTAARPDDYDVCKGGIANPAFPPIQHPAAIHLTRHQLELSCAVHVTHRLRPPLMGKCVVQAFPKGSAYQPLVTASQLR